MSWKFLREMLRLDTRCDALTGRKQTCSSRRGIAKLPGIPRLRESFDELTGSEGSQN